MCSFACPLQQLGGGSLPHFQAQFSRFVAEKRNNLPHLLHLQSPHPKGRQSLGFLKKIQRPFFLFFGCVVALMRSTLSRMSSTLGVSKDVFRVVVSNFWRSASARALASALPIVSAIRLPFLEMGHYSLNLIDNCGLFSPARRHYEVRCIPTSLAAILCISSAPIGETSREAEP